MHLLRKLATPKQVKQVKQVKLPNGRIFVARYERVNRVTLARTNIRIKRTSPRAIGPRQQRLKYFGPRNQCKQRQQGAGVQDNVIRGINLGKQAADTELGRMIIDDAVSLIRKRIKNLKINFLKEKINRLLQRQQQYSRLFIATLNRQLKILFIPSKNECYK